MQIAPAGTERHTFTVEVAGGIAALTRLVHVLHSLNFCPDRLTYGPAPDGGVLVVIETTQPAGAAYTLARRLERVVDTRQVSMSSAGPGQSCVESRGVGGQAASSSLSRMSSFATIAGKTHRR